MIRSFKHRGLRDLYEDRTPRRVAPEHRERLRDALAVLSRSKKPSDADLPGLRLHPLKGDQKGHWASVVSGNWRLTFRFENGDVLDFDHLDYH